MKQIFIRKRNVDHYETIYLGNYQIWTDLDSAFNFLKQDVDREILKAERELEDAFFYGKRDMVGHYTKSLETLIARRAVIRRQVVQMKEGRI